MPAVHQAMQNGCNDERGAGEEHDARIQRIQAGEDLPHVSFERADRPMPPSSIVELRNASIQAWPQSQWKPAMPSASDTPRIVSAQAPWRRSRRTKAARGSSGSERDSYIMPPRI